MTNMMTVKELMEILKNYDENETVTLNACVSDYDWAWANLEIGNDAVMETEE